MSSAYIPRKLRDRIAEQGRYRCGYCLTTQTVTGMSLEVDHLTPRALGGPTEEDNLWLACPACNAYKGDRIHARDPASGRTVRLFNPRFQRWSDHFAWIESDTVIEGATAIGRATVEALQLNRTILVAARKLWVSAGWHPPV